ncbi:MAG: hypothetical protein M1821_001753 [Bathelium mastoideum]|nr:MAG: hypothetical protein M1821_001753 [Bathelium mastoideum]KAI9691651.1 MAG: hypothetical protein M1822_007722 [Bathelium mastoideum]
MLLKTFSALSLVAQWASGVVVPPAHTTQHGTWSNLPNITQDGVQFPRQEGGVALIGNDMYVLGGILPSDGTSYPTISTVQKFNFVTKTWKEVSPMPVAMNHPNIAVVQGMIYYLGGLVDTGPSYWSASGSCAVYDPSADKWSVLPDMPEGRAIGSAATMVVDETVYLPGGLLLTNLTNDDEGTTAMFTSYNVRTQQWTVLPDLPAPRDHAGKGIYGNKLYILGGRLFGHWNVVDTVFAYDLNSNRWSTGFAAMPTGRGGCASTTIGSEMFTAGGEGDPNTTTHVWPQMQAYDAAKNIWRSYADMTIPVHGTAAIAYRGGIVVAGGGLEIGGDPTQLVQRFTPYNSSWST